MASPALAPVAPASSTYRRWVIATSLGELVAFSVPTAAQPLRRRAAIRLNHAHAWLYARTGGRAGGRIDGHPVLLLTTTGRASGFPRRTPVQYERVGGDPILVAAAGGAPEPPAWWRNLQSDPGATVQLGGQVWRGRAVMVGGEERRQLWPLVCEHNPRLEAVQRKAGRDLPLIRLVDLVEAR